MTGKEEGWPWECFCTAFFLRVWRREESVRKQTTLLRTRSEPEGPRLVLACSNKELPPANLSWSPSSHCPITSGLQDQVTVINKASAPVGTETHSNSTTSVSAFPSLGPPLQFSVPPSENGITGQDEPRGHWPPESVSSGWKITPH